MRRGWSAPNTNHKESKWSLPNIIEIQKVTWLPLFWYVLQIVQAQKFQEMSLKAILDRSQLIPEFVSLASNGFSDSSSSTFYLLLPVIRHENENTMAVDWKLVKRCLSSPIFRSRGEAKVNAIPCLNYHLELANGPHSINDVKNSLVYAPCKDTFFFISNVVPEKNAYDSFKDSTNHVEHYFKT